MNRYHRQTLLPQIGDAGQVRLGESRVLLVGCGALGTVIAEQLARAGIGFIRIADRDLVELTNLQRQTLFDESDAQKNLPKAIAAASRLCAINSQITIEPHVVDVHAENVERLIENIDLILDGTDNVETRYLLNDVAVKHSIPWVYGACVGTSGRVMGIVLQKTPCLRCVFPTPPSPSELQTCDTAGVLAPAANVVASLQVVEAIKILLGAPSHELISIDVWDARLHKTNLADARREDCITCSKRQFEFLETQTAAAIALCGRDTVQVRPRESGDAIDLSAIALKLAAFGSIQQNPFFVRCQLTEPRLTLTIFPDGRALVHGTSDKSLARSAYARYIGA